MKKEILFLWFGSRPEPSYAQTTINNFKLMNPTWDINYIKYTPEQIKNYKMIDDQCLKYLMENQIKNSDFSTINFYQSLADSYRFCYIRKCFDENKICVYCDLDCFPISKFDDFFITDKLYYKWYPDEPTDRYAQTILGYHQTNYYDNRFNNKVLYRNDIWFMSNCNFKIQPILLYKNINLNQNTYSIDSFIINNKNQENEYFNYRQKFLNNELILGESFANPYFSPVEHFYVRERLKK